MKSYWGVLIAACCIAPCYAQQSDITKDTANNAVPSSLMTQQHAQTNKGNTVQYNTSCFSFFNTDRNPGVNCVPDY
ncbi:hypothetical protein F9C28_15560 [Shimwellia pseudoproteus]|uniref:hypothetical protein n=1 Tax=Shimwellia pseudoproteus TaxID=570012 RepID=UPI0018EDF6C2|nr:hypothetical protein [Shimwellia pseudoproteus]